ncbi:MAG: 5-formyltetrahydrofolate cyclo-ligase [Eubacterium sp.]|nr:5-formyltetrahydrofolate cyclo-ligase [Eubacterium sp.]
MCEPDEQQELTEKKRVLRSAMREKVRALSKEYCRLADQGIFRKVISLPEYQAAETVFCYVGTEQEIDTMPILRDIQASGKRLGVPKCVGRGIMEVRSVTRLEDLKPGKFGIPEPDEDSEVIPPEEIGLGLIPCLTCTRKGERLGYGGGYYDRYLVRGKFPKAVLCREEILSDSVPAGEYDQKMDIVVTENKVLHCL